MGDGALPIAHSSWRVRQLRRGAGSFTLAPFFRRRRICQNINAVLPAATAASQGQRLGASSLSTRSSWRRVLSVAGSPSKCRSSTTSSNSDGSASAVRFVRLKNRAVFQGMSFQGMSSGCCRGRPSGQIVKPLNVPEAMVELHEPDLRYAFFQSDGNFVSVPRGDPSRTSEISTNVPRA